MVGCNTEGCDALYIRRREVALRRIVLGILLGVFLASWIPNFTGGFGLVVRTKTVELVVQVKNLMITPTH